MIDETILYLAHTGCNNSSLRKYEKILSASADWDSDMRVGEPLKKVFSTVLRYDFGSEYVNSGVKKTNDTIIDLVVKRHPKYVLWPSTMYEIQESTFQAIRKLGTFIVGWFFDDECRFEDYSMWWIPYLDYVLTTDKGSVKKYQELSSSATHLLVTSSPEVFKRLEVHKKYDVSFVGSKIADRDSLVDNLKAHGFKVHLFGRGWNNGFVSLDQVVNIYNSSKINLCFVKSYQVGTRPQIKNKIFDICMCGGFLLCEYVQGIEEFFEIDKEIVCFTDIEEAADKIRYYLDHEAEREEIAQAGWRRAQGDHSQTAWLLRTFEKIEKDIEFRKRHAIDPPKLHEMPLEICRLRSLYHLRWAKVLMKEGYNRFRWQEELDLALFYDPENKSARKLRIIGHLPEILHPHLIRRKAI